jgi:alpha-1,6-mannosyltransferase
VALSRVDAAGALSAFGYGLLLAYSRGGQDVHIAGFLGIMFACWALLGLACTASNVPAGKIWLWAIVFRAIGFFGEPVLEDDWCRYLWDGAVFATIGNPYDKPPSVFFGDPNVPGNLQRLLDGINHPDVPTIYGPVCQLAFVISYLIAPGQLWPLKLILIGADLGTMALLGRLISGRKLLLYAWCPLLIKEVAFTAHPDILGIAFIVAALTVPWPRTIAICCALAVGTKIFAAVIAGLLLLRLPKKHWITFGAVLTALYFPFLVQGSLAEFGALKTFASAWEFNSTVFGVIAIWMGTDAAKVICAIMVLIIYAIYGRRWKGGMPHGDWLFGAFFLLSAVVNPWYLLWMLPFVAFYPSAAGIAALIVVSVAYVHGLNLPGSGLGPYDHPIWVRVVEVVTIFVAGSLQFLLRTPEQTRE